MVRLYNRKNQISQNIKIIAILIGLSFLTSHASQDSFNFNDYLKSFINKLQFSKKNNNNYAIGLITIESELKEAKKFINKLFELRDDPKIKGLILHINCNGGVIGTCQAIFSELKKFKQKKPIIVIIENACFSGAYYIATAADYIFALPSSDIGGIGVISFIKKYKDLKFSENQISGIMEPIIIRSGKYKDPANPYIALDEELIDDIKQRVLKKYHQFIIDVAQARKLSLDDQEVWVAEGKSFVGTEALELGLIDAIGDFTDAITKMNELIKQHDDGTIEKKLEIIDFTL